MIVVSFLFIPSHSSLENILPHLCNLSKTVRGYIFRSVIVGRKDMCILNWIDTIYCPPKTLHLVDSLVPSPILNIIKLFNLWQSGRSEVAHIFYKGQVVNIFSYMGHMVSAPILQPCCNCSKAVEEDT